MRNSLKTLLVMLVVAGCDAGGKDGAPPKAANVIRVGHFPNITHAQALVARRKRWFEEKLGGYALARPMKSIGLGDVVRRFDGRLAPIACVSRVAYERCTCPDEDHCGLRLLMSDVRSAVVSVLDRHTLEDVVEVTLRKMRRNRRRVPFPVLTEVRR